MTQRLPQGLLVGVLDLAAHGQAVGDTGHLEPQGPQFLGHVGGGGLPFKAGVEAQDHLLDPFLPDPVQQFPDADIVRTHSLQGRNHPAQDVVEALKPPHLFDGQQVPRLRHHHELALAAPRVGAEGTEFLVRKGEAAPAEPNLLFELHQGVGQFQHLGLRGPEEVHSQAGGGLFPHPGPAAQSHDHPSQGRRVGVSRHVHSLVQQFINSLNVFLTP